MSTFREYLDEDVNPALLTIKNYIGTIRSKLSLKDNKIKIVFEDSETTDRFIDLWLSTDEDNKKMKSELESNGVQVNLKSLNSKTVQIG
jgi:hypothetical protein